MILSGWTPLQGYYREESSIPSNGFYTSSDIEQTPVTEERMRRPVRPFVKEFKTRWSKSSKSPAQTEAECDKPRFTQSFLDLDMASQARDRDDDEYRAALKAADAAFGTLSQIVPEVATAPSHVGRVLPSLVEDIPLQLVRSPEAKEKSTASRKVRKNEPARKAASPAPVVRRKRAAPLKAQSVTTLADLGSQTESSETRLDPATRRAGRPIQKRWVMKAELKAGEKWKRRLRKPAW